MLSDLSRCVMFRWIHVKRQVLKFKYGHPLSLARRFIIIVELDDECCKSSRFICPHTAMQVNSIVARCFAAIPVVQLRKVPVSKIELPR